MKSLLSILILINSHSIFSQTLDDIPKSTLSRFTDYLKKKKGCKLASIPVPDKKYPLTQSQWDKNTTVICVADIVREEGTVNESKGCGFFYYDMARPDGENYDMMQVVNLKLTFYDSTIRNKDCTPQTLIELAEKDVFDGRKGDDFIFGREDMISAMMKGKHVLFYWENDALKKTYEDLRQKMISRIEVKVKENAEKEKKWKEDRDLQQKKEKDAKKIREDKASQDLKIQKEKSKKLNSMFE